MSSTGEVVNALREIATYLRLRGESRFKTGAYERAADAVAQLGNRLPSRVEKGTLREVPGIGASLERIIAEAVRTGRVGYLEELREEFPPGLLELLKLPALPPRKALQLWKKLGVTDLASLEHALRQGEVRGLRGFGEAAERQLLSMLEGYQTTGALRLGIWEALEVAEELLAYLRKSKAVVRAELAGEARRFSDTVGAVQLVAATRSPKRVLDRFAQYGQVAQVLERTPSLCRVRLHRWDAHAELWAVAPEAFASAWHAATGAEAHRQHLQALAEHRGVALTDEAPFADEEALYAAAGLPFIPAELREDGGELEAAREGRLGRLLEVDDLRGAVHSHSTWSDGKDTLEDMVREAEEWGLEYLTVTEHSPTASYAGGLPVDRLRALWEELEQVQRRHPKVRLLKGTEADILPDGRLDYPDEILAQCDVVVGSIHARHRMDRAAMTERILRGMDSPYLSVVGHLTGRLINRREPYAIDVAAIFAKAAKKQIAIEVNGSPDRLDISSEQVREAIRLGIPLVISSDAHSTAEFENLWWGVQDARRGWAEPKDVLNTRSVEAFLAEV